MANNIVLVTLNQFLDSNFPFTYPFKAFYEGVPCMIKRVDGYIVDADFAEDAMYYSGIHSHLPEELDDYTVEIIIQGLA